MNETAIYHRSESAYCYAIASNKVTLRLHVDRQDDIEGVSVVYGRKYDFYRYQKTQAMERKYLDRLYAYYETTLSLSDVRLTYVFLLKEKGKTFYYSEDGLTEDYDFAYNFYNCFQYAYLHESSVIRPVSFLETSVYYEIFVDRFAMGNRGKDCSYINMRWNDKPTPKSFAGGDLEGIIQKLPYLKSLGVNGLYLTPIFASPSNHKYDTSSYKNVDPMFGDEETLRRLVEKAHKNKMTILLDAVFNHVSETHPFYQDVKEKGKESKYYSYFKHRNGKVECFSSCSYMPKWDTDNPEVQDYLIGIGRHYVEDFDIDGWRLDVSDEVSHVFWKRFRTEMKKIKAEVALIGENWHEAASFLRGDEFDSIMNYAFTKALLDYLAYQKIDSEELANRLNGLLIRNPSPISSMMLNLLDTHDTHRFYTEVKKDLSSYLIAVALLFFFPGVPCLYYGDESLMEGGYDPDSRRGFKENKDNEAYKLIQVLAKLRKSKDFALGETRIEYKDELLVLARIGKNETYTLKVHKGDRHLPYSSKDVIVSHHYKDGWIQGFGFIIERRKA